MVAPLPAAQLEPAPYGLVNPKTLVDETERWESGFEQETIACNSDINLLDLCNTGAAANVKSAEGVFSLGEYKPFAVQSIVRCSTLGSRRVDWEDRALNALEACTSKGVEYEFWEGPLAQAAIADGDTDYPNRYLNNGDAEDVTPTPGTPVKVRYGLALLEGALADAGCGNRGFVHAPVSVASVLPVKEKDGVLQTPLGNYLIAGSGYPGTGTGLTNPSLGSRMWLYATGPVMVRLGDKEVSPGSVAEFTDSSTNTIALSAERAASVVWDGCAHFGVLVDLSLDYA